jgi:hypothetical protein
LLQGEVSGQYSSSRLEAILGKLEGAALLKFFPVLRCSSLQCYQTSAGIRSGEGFETQLVLLYNIAYCRLRAGRREEAKVSLEVALKKIAMHCTRSFFFFSILSYLSISSCTCTFHTTLPS